MPGCLTCSKQQLVGFNRTDFHSRKLAHTFIVALFASTVGGMIQASTTRLVVEKRLITQEGAESQFDNDDDDDPDKHFDAFEANLDKMRRSLEDPNGKEEDRMYQKTGDAVSMYERPPTKSEIRDEMNKLEIARMAYRMKKEKVQDLRRSIDEANLEITRMIQEKEEARRRQRETEKD